MTLPASLHRWSPFRSARTALALSLVLTLGLMLLAGGVMLLARGDVTHDADKDALNIARAAGQDIARNLELFDLQLRTIARQMQDPAVQALPPALRRAMLFDGVARDEHLGFINVLNAHGEVIANSAAAVPRGGNFASRDYFQAQRRSARDALFIGAPFDKVHDAWTMIPLSHRLANPDGSFAGVVMGSVRLDYFAELFSRFAVGRQGSIALLLDDGTLLQRIPAAPTDIGHIARPNLLTAAATAWPSNLLDPVDRQMRRFVLQRVDGLPLVVAVGLAPADIYAAWNSRAKTMLAAVAALGLLNGLLLLRLRKVEIRREADAVMLRDQALELQRRAEQHAAMVAGQKQAHDRRVQQLDEITHDMRTSLHSLLGHTDLVRQKGSLNPGQAHHLASLRSAGEHLRDLADRFLHDARNGDGPALLLEPTDIRAQIEDLGRIAGLAAEEKGLALILEADGSVPARVVTDGRRLRLILANLLENAIKYTDRGSVALHASLEPTGLRCVISDTGCGLPNAQKRRLLQTDDETAVPTGRGGRGLSIVRRHIDALGGQVSCLHHPGGGSIVCVDVPVTPAPTPGPGRTSAALRVLVVDDSAVSREPTAELLRAAGHKVTAERSGEAAVQRVRGAEFDTVVLDARMPGLSGPETARRIRALPGDRGRVPIVVLSATPREQGLAAWQQAGISAYVEKSRDIATLSQAVCEAAHPAARGKVAAGSGNSAAASAPNDTHLSALAEEVRTVRVRLDGPRHAVNQDVLNELVHRLAGDAAQCGFAALSAACQALSAVGGGGHRHRLRAGRSDPDGE